MARARRVPTIFHSLSLLFILATFPACQAQELGASAGKQAKKLYVLDAGNEFGKSQVLVVDLTSDKVVQTYPAGYQPDMALSPDGTRLYLSSAFEKKEGGLENVLEIFDTAS